MFTELHKSLLGDGLSLQITKEALRHYSFNPTIHHRKLARSGFIIAFVNGEIVHLGMI